VGIEPTFTVYKTVVFPLNEKARVALIYRSLVQCYLNQGRSTSMRCVHHRYDYYNTDDTKVKSTT
jgi:hypothetical protein